MIAPDARLRGVKSNGNSLSRGPIGILPEGATPTIADRDFTIATVAAPSAVKAEAAEEQAAAEGEEGEVPAEGEEGTAPAEAEAGEEPKGE